MHWLRGCPTLHPVRAITAGGLLVSANRTAGVVKFIRILSEQGGTVVFRVHGDSSWERNSTSAAPPTAIPASGKVTAAARGE